MDFRGITSATAIATVLGTILNHLLSRTAKRDEIRFAKFYGRRAKVIEMAYRRLSALIDAVEEYLSLRQTSAGNAQTYEQVKARIGEFKRFYYAHAIYLPREQDETARTLETVLRTTATFYSSGLDLKEDYDELETEIEPFMRYARQRRDALREDFYNLILGRKSWRLPKPIAEVVRRIRAESPLKGSPMASNTPNSSKR